MQLAALGRALRFKFPSPLLPRHSAEVGRSILTCFVLWALLQGTLRHAAPLWLPAGLVRGLVILLLLWVAVLLLQRYTVRLSAADIGLRRWRMWSAEERWFLLQALLALSLLSLALFLPRFAGLLSSKGLSGLLLSVMIGLGWGVVQEWVYRGWLQNELHRRLGPWAGLLLANLAFTFGPLHAELFHWGSSRPVAWGGFAAIFAIGSLFGWLYWRSGNVWIPALLHGLWPLNMPA